MSLSHDLGLPALKFAPKTDYMQQEIIPVKVGLLELLYSSQGIQGFLIAKQANILHGLRNGWEYGQSGDGVQLRKWKD